MGIPRLHELSICLFSVTVVNQYFVQKWNEVLLCFYAQDKDKSK